MIKRSIGYKRLLFGFIFLMSPDIVIVDLLPDFIGYIFIISGISVLADIDERADDAKSIAKRLLALSCIKFVLMFYMPSLEKTNLLVVTFSLAIIDIILLLPFLKQFFHSLDYTATRQGILISSKKTSEIRILTVLFLVIKDILMVAPSVISLVDPAETGNYTTAVWHIDFSALFNVLTVLAFFVSTVIFIFMTIKLSVYFVKLARNRELISRLYSNYEKNVLNVPSRMLLKRTRAFRSMIIVSPIFFIDFYVDFIEVIPTAIGFLLILIFSVYVERKMGMRTLPLTVVSVLGTLVSAISFFYRFYWQKKLGAPVEYAFADKEYTVIIAALTSILTVVVFFLLSKALSSIEERYLDETESYKGVIISGSALILAVFDYILYALPLKNVTFAFPNLIFAVFFVYVVVDRIHTVTSGILAKYKIKDF